MKPSCRSVVGASIAAVICSGAAVAQGYLQVAPERIHIIARVDDARNTVLLAHAPDATRVTITNNNKLVGDCSASTCIVSVPRAAMRSGDNNFVVSATRAGSVVKTRAILTKP